jgi:hypothetical protein
LICARKRRAGARAGFDLDQADCAWQPCIARCRRPTLIPIKARPSGGDNF